MGKKGVSLGGAGGGGEARGLSLPVSDRSGGARREKSKGGAGGGGGVFDNPAFRLLLLNVYLCQIGNALLASTQPIFARYVIDLFASNIGLF